MIMPFGCMISGSYAEFMGKRRGMQLLTIPQFISWMIYYFSSNSWHLILSACIIGMVTGLNLSSVNEIFYFSFFDKLFKQL